MDSQAPEQLDAASWSDRIAHRLEENRQQARQLLDEHLARLRSSDVESVAGDEDLRRRHEMAMDDIRDLQARNEQLQQQIDELQTSDLADRDWSDDGAMDWESQKQRLLAELKEDSAGGDERKSMDDLIHQTDRIVEDRDREIHELKQLLDEQSSNIGQMAVGANAIAALVDTDDLVQQEREVLREMQEEWREKLRQAEVEISVERAKLARERTELEEKLGEYEREKAELLADAGGDRGGKGKRKSGGRWLAQLGLNGEDGNR